MEWMLGQSSGAHGFLPTRGSFMLDLVCVALLAVLPLMGISIYLARCRQKYDWHKKLQIALATLLLAVVLAFEVDIRFVTDWQQLAGPSPYFEQNSWNPVWFSLIVHLCFAIPTLVLWFYVVIQAIRHFPSPAAPSPHSRSHARWARLAAFGMLMTAVTGWIFYWMAFVA